MGVRFGGTCVVAGRRLRHFAHTLKPTVGVNFEDPTMNLRMNLLSFFGHCTRKSWSLPRSTTFPNRDGQRGSSSPVNYSGPNIYWQAGLTRTVTRDCLPQYFRRKKFFF